MYICIYIYIYTHIFIFLYKRRRLKTEEHAGQTGKLLHVLTSAWAMRWWSRTKLPRLLNPTKTRLLKTVLVRYYTLQHAATHCNTLFETVFVRWSHTATHCSIVQYTAIYYLKTVLVRSLHTAAHCNILQHTAAYWNIMQHPATHYLKTVLVRSLHTVTHCLKTTFVRSDICISWVRYQYFCLCIMHAHTQTPLHPSILRTHTPMPTHTYITGIYG